MSVSAPIHVVIMAGGIGTRLWPISRRGRPKQFQPLLSGQTMLKDTYLRILPLTVPENVWIVTGADFVDMVHSQLPDLPARNVLGEPVGRSSAPAVALAVARIARAEPETIVLATPADSYISDSAAYCDYVALAVEACRRGSIVTLGVVPSRPETRFGYIKRGGRVENAVGAYWVERFTEKPDAETAAQYLAHGGYYWNMGQFVFQSAFFMERCEQHLPQVAAAMHKLAGSEADAELMERAYRDLPAISLDYGIAEKEERMAVVPTALEWSDVGSWRAVKEIAERHATLDLKPENHIGVDSEDCFVLAGSGRLVVTVGVKGYVVIDTPDALLIVDEEKDQLVRDALEEIERRGKKGYL
ncbi:MAG: sugar phosphate nucleotidyltransferase [Armatimonadota bacterium]|jgi:mannose-1-phosphate guanylyltransferase